MTDKYSQPGKVGYSRHVGALGCFRTKLLRLETQGEWEGMGGQSSGALGRTTGRSG